MFLDVNKIGPAGLAFEKMVRLQPLEDGSGQAIEVAAAWVRGDVARGTRGFDLLGHLDAEVVLTCSRCVESFSCRISSDFRLLLVPVRDEGLEAAEELDEEEAAARFDCADGLVDLGFMVSEQIYLSLPLKPVCHDGCRGLCPECGTNRNVSECSCAGERVDPRLAPLLRLLKNNR